MVNLGLSQNARYVVFSVLIIYFLVLCVSFIEGNSGNKKKISPVAFSKSNKQVKGIKATPTNTPTPTQPSSGRTVYLGMWTQGFWDKQTNTLHPEVLHAVENKINKKVAIAHYYRGWDALDSTALLNELQTISANGWRPMISANPYFFDRCKANGMPLYKAIASGNCDEFLHSVGRNLKAFGKPVFLRFAWEMNVSSMEWQISRTGSSNADFISAWRRVHDIIYSESATNVLFVFCPDVGGNVSFSQIYPGDAYIDWVGLDGYNWGTTQSWSSWKSFSSLFSSSYASLTKVAPNKPLMLGETNTTYQGGDKPAWYKDALQVQIPFNFPKIKAVVVYNEDRTATEQVNWLIDVTSTSLLAFLQGIGSSIYASSF